MRNLFEFISEKTLNPGWFGRVTIYVEDGKPIRFTTEQSHRVSELEAIEGISGRQVDNHKSNS